MFTGASNFLVPLAGGALQSLTRWPAAPYVLAASIVAVALALQVRMVRRAGG
jgi:hypothetical protein